MCILALAPLVVLSFAADLNVPAAQAPASPSQSEIRKPYRVESETDDVRVARVVLAPGERATTQSPAGTVIVYLTADLDGRMPSSTAAWQAAGSLDMENHGPARFEAVLVEFKKAAPEQPAVTRPDYLFGSYPMADVNRARSEMLVDTPDVRVTRERYPATSYLEPPRVDATDTVVVYLRGGYALIPDRPLNATLVHRGDAVIFPASAPYALTNPATDPSEFVLIAHR